MTIVKKYEEKKYIEPSSRNLTAKVILHHYRFPKTKVHNPGDYAIVLCEVKEVLAGTIPDDAYDQKNCICITGKIPRLEEGMDYFFQGTLVQDPKWGMQYNTTVMRLSYDLSTEEKQRKFFSFFLTDHQIDCLFAAHTNPVKLLEDKDIKMLTSIKGIGPVTAQRLCLKYEENVDNGHAYIELQDLGLTKNALDKLIREFGSPDIVVDILKENPYRLISLVRGYGWVRTDAIAKKQGFTSNCPERVLAYAQYYLYQKSNDGHSCCDADELVAATVKECPPITTDTVVDILKGKMVGDKEFEAWYEKACSGPKDLELPYFYYSSLKHQIGTFYLRTVEEKIKRNLIRLKNATPTTSFDRETCEELIKKVEEEKGFTYTHEQQKAIWNVLNNNISIITGSAGCVDCDTEFFNGKEWKKISEYSEEDEVLVYKEDGTAVLEKPLNYIKLPCEQLWHTSTKYGLDMCTCDEHNVYYITSKGNLFHQPFSKVKEMHEKSKTGFRGKFITTFKTNRKGIELTDNEIKIMLAVIADGSFINHTDSKNTRCRFHIKKERKKEELRKIFSEAGIEWRENPQKNGYNDFFIRAPRKEKEFTSYWYNCSQDQLQLICENVLKWDGSCYNNRMSFSTSSKQSADFVQYVFSSCGYRATISSNDRRSQKYLTNNKIYERKSIEYVVTITKRNLIGIGGFHDPENKTKITSYKTIDGYKYCFTVSSHMWVMRRNNKILITGNCGKSSTLAPIIKIFENKGLHVAQCALSGRAASLLTEYTHLTGKTIHRLLRYVPETGQFQYDENIKMPYDVIILDEASMVGEELFLSLISAIKSGSRLILLGDTKQLPPINVGNLLHDMISSGYIPTTVLTIIQRQAAKSGIVSQSLQVCNGKALCKNDFSGSDIRGELKDFKLIASSEPMLVHKQALDEYKRLYFDLHVQPEDIEIIVPVRTRGMNSCRFFNAEIQAIVNGDESENSVDVTYADGDVKYDVTFRVNDRVMVIHNNYHAKTLTGHETAVFNGNMGYITEIYKDSMVIKMDKEEDEDGDCIILPRADWGDVTHAWATTAHKCQGSQFKYVIVVLDNSSFPLLIREWLYTALTRARKHCTLVGQPLAINTAVRNSDVKIKQTWLKDELYHELLSDEGVKI